MPKATRPLEYVCLFPMPVPPVKEHDDLYGFMAVDAFSKFLFHLGVLPGKGADEALKAVDKLMEDKDFLKYRDHGFTLVLHSAYQNRIADFKTAVAPFQGEVIINETMCLNEMLPVADHMIKNFQNDKNE